MEALFRPCNRIASLLEEHGVPDHENSPDEWNTDGLTDRELTISLAELVENTSFSLDDFYDLFSCEGKDVLWMTDRAAVSRLDRQYEGYLMGFLNAFYPGPYGACQGYFDYTAKSLVSGKQLYFFGLTGDDVVQVMSALFHLASRCPMSSEGELWISASVNDDARLTAFSNDSLGVLVRGKLKKVAFDNAHFTEAQATAVFNSNADWTQLCFWLCEFSDNGEALFESLRSSTSPAHLHFVLEEDDPSPFLNEMHATFPSAIGATTSLKSIKIEDVGLPMEEEFVLALADGLKENTSIAELELDVTRCRLEGLAGLLQALHAHPAIKKLSLRYNEDFVSSESHDPVAFTKLLVELADKNTNLEEIDLLEDMQCDDNIFKAKVRTRLDRNRFRPAVDVVKRERNTRLRVERFVTALDAVLRAIDDGNDDDDDDENRLANPLDTLYFVIRSNSDVFSAQHGETTNKCGRGKRKSPPST